MRNTVLHLIATLLVALTTVATYAVRPLRIAMTARQSDGSTIVVYKEGETRLGITFHVTVDDIAVVKNAKGDFCYASLVDGKLEPSEVVAHDAVARSDEEKAWLASNGISAQRVLEEASSGKHYSPVRGSAECRHTHVACHHGGVLRCEFHGNYYCGGTRQHVQPVRRSRRTKHRLSEELFQKAVEWYV